MLNAALINGTASHALDFDDCSNTLGGHPSAPILPALWAIAPGRERQGVHRRLCRRGRMRDAARPRGEFPSLREGLASDRDARHVRQRGGLRASPGAERRATRHGARARGFDGVRHQGQFRHHDQAVPCRADDPQRLAGGAAGEGRHDRQCRRARAPAGLLRGLQRRRQFQSRTASSSIGAIRSISPIPASRSSAIPAAAARIPRSMPCCICARRTALSPERVAKVESWTHPRRLAHTNRPNPQSGLDGKFSIQYVLARALMHGIVSMEHFTDDAVRDPATRALMARVHVRARSGGEARDQRSLLLPPADHDHGRRDVSSISSIVRSAATATIRCRPARWKQNSATARRPCSTRKAVENAARPVPRRLRRCRTCRDVLDVIAAGVTPPAVATRSRAYA